MEYIFLDFGSGKRLERWGDVTLIRPDPTASGTPSRPALWAAADAEYEGEKGKGAWKRISPIPDDWLLQIDDCAFHIRLAPYKHTGLFPEQAENWRWMRSCARGRSLNILNLFAYTGGATVALAKDGHRVTHVDASKPAIAWAKENALANSISHESTRWILEDASLFAAREVKRGNTYDAILLDPPAYGHSPSGSTWRAERDLKPLLESCIEVLSKQPSFLVLNGYARNDTPESFHRLLSGILHTKRPDLDFRITADELYLSTADGRRLSTGIVARCAFSSSQQH